MYLSYSRIVQSSSEELQVDNLEELVSDLQNQLRVAGIKEDMDSRLIETLSADLALEAAVDRYSIGSEGASAWAWVGHDIEDMRCIGFTAKTRQEAIQKVLEAIEDDEAKVG
jgi:hypothetical protein